MVTGFEGAISPMTMGWASVAMANDAEERAVVTASMNAIGQGIAAGTQVIHFPASKVSDFKAGFISILATTVGQLACIGILIFLTTRDRRRNYDADDGDAIAVDDEGAFKAWKGAD